MKAYTGDQHQHPPGINNLWLWEFEMETVRAPGAEIKCDFIDGRIPVV